MKERVQEIPAKLVEFWNRYSSRQKTISAGTDTRREGR